MAIRFTVSRFPKNDSVKDNSGIPWGCVVKPFHLDEEAALSPAPLTPADVVARCEDCFGYINHCCQITKYRWRCSMCDAHNKFTKEQLQRYGSESLLTMCEELNTGVVEFDVAADDEGGQDDDVYTRPVFLAAVDLSASEEFLELVKSALLAALEALPAAALFGLVTFSRKLGMYDLQGSVPILKRVTIPRSAKVGLPVDLADVLPLEELLAPIETCKDQIAAALEMLQPASSWDVGHDEGEPVAGRGFGSAMSAILQYLSENKGTFVSARLFAFLSGPPDWGAGQIDTSRYAQFLASSSASAAAAGGGGGGGDAEGDEGPLPEQEDFYTALATLAVQAGVCVDLFAISGEFMDLASLKPLSMQSGGGLYLYQNTEDATLPQDIYRMLTRPHAFGGLLRLRTSYEFSIAAAYGHFFPDAEYENLYHVVACDPFQSFAFDFEFNAASQFSGDTTNPPVLQLAFQYTVLLPAEEEDKPDGGTTTPPLAPGTPNQNGAGTPTSAKKKPLRYLLRRRLRLCTVKVHVAATPAEIYDSVDPEAILFALTHKVIEASLEEGVKEGRQLLQDWMVILVAQYNDTTGIVHFGDRSDDVSSRLDVSFSQTPSLQSIPRLIFGLLHSPLLRLHGEGVHPDYRTYLQCLYGGLPPSSLVRAIYPVLSSYSTPDKLAYPRHSLSRAALVTSGSPIFLLDAFTTLVLYYAPTAPPNLPFPPPQNSLIRTTINEMKQGRGITPRLVMVRGGYDNAEIFERFLVEEHDVGGSAGPSSGMSFVAFLGQVAEDAREYMK